MKKPLTEMDQLRHMMARYPRIKKLFTEMDRVRHKMARRCIRDRKRYGESAINFYTIDRVFDKAVARKTTIQHRVAVSCLKDASRFRRERNYASARLLIQQARHWRETDTNIGYM